MCFKNVVTFTINYKFNMDDSLRDFCEWIEGLGYSIAQRKTKNHCFVDFLASPSSSVKFGLHQISVHSAKVPVPNNKPMDQGVIHTLKSHYCRHLVSKLIYWEQRWTFYYQFFWCNKLQSYGLEEGIDTNNFKLFLSRFLQSWG